MQKKLLLTGKPQIGKTTIISKAIASIHHPSIKIGGFYTKEIREKGIRSGFEIKTNLSNKTDILAHVDFESDYRIGKYKVNKNTFEKLILDEFNLCNRENADLIIIDEIGKMEMISKIFCEKIFEILSGNVPVLGVLKNSKGEFLDKIFSLKTIEIIDVNLLNREKVFNDIIEWLNKILKINC